MGVEVVALGDACLWDLSPNGVFLSEIVVALQL